MPITLAPQAATEERTFAPIPAGTYFATIFDIVIKENKNHDGYYLAVTCAIQDEPYTNRRVNGTVSLKPTARWKLNQFLTALGHSNADLSKEIKIFDKNEEAPGDLDDTVCPVFLALLLDMEVRIDVIQEPGEGGKTYASVSRWGKAEPVEEIPF